MHTYRTSARAGKSGFQVGTGSGAGGQHFDAIGPHFEKEAEAAAFAAYMNGGRYEPDAIAELMKPAEEEREKQRKEREQQAKRDEDAEKQRKKAEWEAANPDKQKEQGEQQEGEYTDENDRNTRTKGTRSQADESMAKIDANREVEAAKTQKANRTHAARAKHHVKRSAKPRRHK